MAKRYTRKYYAYTIVLGLVGFGVLLWQTAESGYLGPVEWWPFLLFTLIAFVSKFLSFQMMGVVTLTMDTAVYVTAVLCLGPVSGAWSVFLSMYLKVVWDMVDREVVSRGERRPFLENVTAPLFQGGTGALATLGAAWPVPAGEFAARGMDAEVHVLWLAPALAGLFVVVQYSLVLNKYWLLGYSWPKLSREVLLPGVLTEMLLMPLAMVMTVTYHGLNGISPSFLILTTTYLIVNLVLKRLSDAQARLNDRVKELQSLNALGRTICSTLQAEALVPRLGEETLAVVEHADAVAVVVWDEEAGRFATRLSVRSGGEGGGMDEGGAARVADLCIAEKKGVSTERLGRGQDVVHLKRKKAYGLSGGWMGLPVRVCEETIGVLVAWARDAGRLTGHDMGLLQMIGQQAAVALQNSRLYVLATVDGLTRLFVRRYFDRRLSEEVSRARRHDATFSLMLVDLDDFKQVNDRYGHAAGDMVLRKVAEVLLGEVRSLDIPARVGGDEMAVICPEVGWQGAKVLAERILSRLRGEGVTVEGVRLEISVSIGLASYREHCAAGGREIMAVADEALYRAKSGGKGMLVVAGE